MEDTLPDYNLYLEDLAKNVNDMTVFELKKSIIFNYDKKNTDAYQQQVAFLAKLHIEDGINYSVYDSSKITEECKKLCDEITNKEIVIENSYGFYNNDNYKTLSLFGKIVLTGNINYVVSLFDGKCESYRIPSTNKKCTAPYLEIACYQNNLELCQLLHSLGYVGKTLIDQERIINHLIESDDFELLDWLQKNISILDISKVDTDVAMVESLKNANSDIITTLITYGHKLQEKHILECFNNLSYDQYKNSTNILDFLLKNNYLTKNIFFQIAPISSKYLGWGLTNGYKYDETIYMNAFKLHDRLKVPVLSFIYNYGLGETILRSVVSKSLDDISKCKTVIWKWIVGKNVMFSSYFLKYFITDIDKFKLLVKLGIKPNQSIAELCVKNIDALEVFIYIINNSYPINDNIIQVAIDSNNIEAVEILFRIDFRYKTYPIVLTNKSLIDFITKNKTDKNSKCTIM